MLSAESLIEMILAGAAFDQYEKVNPNTLSLAVSNLMRNIALKASEFDDDDLRRLLDSLLIDEGFLGLSVVSSVDQQSAVDLISQQESLHNTPALWDRTRDQMVGWWERLGGCGWRYDNMTIGASSWASQLVLGMLYRLAYNGNSSHARLTAISGMGNFGGLNTRTRAIEMLRAIHFDKCLARAYRQYAADILDEVGSSKA